jgi:hypothetical protein
MKILFKDYIGWSDGKHLVCVAYFKNGRWRIYEGSSYDVRNAKTAKELIDEVAEEKKVKRQNIKLVKPTFVDFKVVDF